MLNIKVNKNNLFQLFMTFILIMLFLSFINLKRYYSSIKVLGAETTESNSINFWTNFLIQNPNYVPGWIETGDMDAAREIDPNFNLE